MRKQNNAAIIVIHEIYGLNNHMKTICESLSEHYFDVFCPNLLEREPFDYTEEDVAYQYFIEKVGFSNASEKVKQVLIDLKHTYDKVFIVGFSVGATTAWLCSEEYSVNGIVGYYGSRIRNYMNITPQCPTLLFFPEKEPSFNIDELIIALKSKQIEVHKFKGQHGFSDPNSSKYNEDSSQKALKEMIDFFVSLS